jgi:hypothetical protein
VQEVRTRHRGATNRNIIMFLSVRVIRLRQRTNSTRLSKHNSMLLSFTEA